MTVPCAACGRLCDATDRYCRSCVVALRAHGPGRSGSTIGAAHLLDAIGLAVISAAQDATITYWNRWAETLYGWPAIAVLGQNALDLLVTAPHREDAMAITRRVRAGETWTGHCLFQRRDHRTLPVLTVNTPLTAPDGTIVGIVAASLDFTAWRREQSAREEAARLAGVQLAARSAARALQNVVQSALLGFETASMDPALPPDLQPLMRHGAESMQRADAYLDGLQHVRRVVTHELGGPGGPVLDVVRSRQAVVVVIEDDASTRRLIENTLVPQYVAQTAQGEESGWDLIRATRPDAIVVDLRLPGLSGVELLHRLQADTALRAVPVLVVTGSTSQAELNAALAAGARDWLHKPFSPGELLRRVQALVGP
jgi:PAS domain S-box-containing protein